MDFGTNNEGGKNEALNHQELEMLVEKVQNGDLKAFSKVYELLVDKVYKYLYFKVKQEEAFDLTETVFLKVWENIRKYQRKSGSTFVSWVFRITHNLLVDHYRLHKEALELDINTPDQKIDNNPIYLAEQSLSRDSLKKALGQMKDDYREVLMLSFINGLDNDEVATLMRKSEGGLRVLKFRALQELKKILLNMGIKYQ